jgi:hypothetical protein
MTNPKHPVVGLAPLRRSQFPKSPPRPAARTEPEIIVDVDLSEITEVDDARETPMLPPKPKRAPPPLPKALRLYALLEGVMKRR